MTQYSFGVIVPEETSGEELADSLNQWRDAVHTGHSGSARPAYAQQGMLWLDTSVVPWKLKLYDGTDDVTLIEIDPPANAPIFSWGPEVAVASAATVNIAQVKSNVLRITGTTTITGLGSAAEGIYRFIRFTGALTLTQGSSLELISGANIVTAAGDRTLLISTGTGWRMVFYQRADGTTVINRDASVAEYRAKATKLVRADVAFAAADPVALTDAATIVVDLNAGLNFKVTLAGNRTLGFPAVLVPGQSGRIRVKQDATGGRTLAFAAGYKFTSGLVPALTTTANAKNYLDYYVDDDNTIHIMLSKDVK